MKFIKIPLNRWVVGLGIGLGLIFGNDAVVAILRPLIEALAINLPAA